MNVIDEVFGDFSTRRAQIFVSGDVVIIDNVKKIIVLSEDIITVDYGKGKVSVNGCGLWMEYISNGRMCIKGKIMSIDFK